MELLVAKTTDTPVWWLFGATVALAVATGVLGTATVFLAVFARRALAQLAEIKKDRHVQVMTEFGRRWNSEMMVEALILECHYSPDELVELVRTARQVPAQAADREEGRLEAQSKLRVLLRILDFFEDLAFMSRFASLDTNSLATFKGLIVDEWQTWRGAIHELRSSGDDFSYTQFQKLYESMSTVPDL